MSALSQNSPASTPAQTMERPPISAWRVANPLTALDSILRRDEADILFIAGNVALVAIEWPVAVLTLASHAMARSRFRALRAVAEVAEEAE